MASSSKSPSADHREDLSPTDAMVEKSVPNEVRLSKRERNPYPYPYPEDVKVEELFPKELELPFSEDFVEWNKNYVEWRQKMLGVIDKEGLRGFIDGTIEAPPETVITSVNGPNGGKTIHEERESEEYVAWKRSDDLVRKWILNRLGWGMSALLDRFKTAKGLWERIAKWDSVGASMASSSKSPSAYHRKDLSPTDVPKELEYPYPDAYVEWREKNYVEWRRKMLDIITSAGLRGFIDGTVQAPPKTVITSVNSPNRDKTIHKERDNEEYVAWKISDDLVREWILDRLDWNMNTTCGRFKTAKELWEGIAEWEQSERTIRYLPLYKATLKGDWEAADKIIRDKQDAVRAPITFQLETALIVAVKMVGGKDFVEKLVEKMSSDDLAICDEGGRTALHRAVEFGNIGVAKLLVGRNKALPNMATHLKETPLFYAAERADRKMVEWLMEVTDYKVVFDERGFKIVYQLTHSQLYDIALEFLKHCPWLAYWYEKEDDLKFQALAILAGAPSSFKSGHTFNYLEELIYSKMKFPTKKNEGVDLENTADNHRRGDLEAPPASNNSGAEAPPASNNSGATNGGWAYAVRKILHAIFSKVIETLFDKISVIKPIREIQKKKMLHNQALDLLKFLCKEAIESDDYSAVNRNFRLPLEQATSMGIHEIVEEILRVYPYAVYLENDKKQSIFQQAIVFRQEKVFNLIYQHEESRAMVLSKGDEFNNNALHLAGYVLHPEQIYRRPSAALQMQSELQWFKGVERLVLPKNREERNKMNKTPAEAFSDAHKEMVKEGHEWMKDTVESCTIVASIIATVAFAAALQVPGGNNDNGLPNFNQQKAFIIFGIFNESALFSSLASLLLFLSILSSRYAEEDFLFILPSQLILGLAWLILSILFTMTAFGAALFLVFGEHKVWIHIPAIIVLAFVLLTLRTFQFPLIKDMIKSTCGLVICCKKGNRISNRLYIKKRL